MPQSLAPLPLPLPLSLSHLVRIPDTVTTGHWVNRGSPSHSLITRTGWVWFRTLGIWVMMLFILCLTSPGDALRKCMDMILSDH
ncbi:hypothetical protein FKM82_026674 [Ascaphus truei]